LNIGTVTDGNREGEEAGTFQARKGRELETELYRISECYILIYLYLFKMNLNILFIPNRIAFSQ